MNAASHGAAEKDVRGGRIACFERSAAALAASVNERHPEAACLGLAFWLAWRRVVCPVVWNAGAPWSSAVADSAYSFCAHVVLDASLALALVVLALLDGRLGNRYRSSTFHAVSCASAFVSTLALVAVLALDLSVIVFGVACAVAGIAMAALLVRGMYLFGSMPPSRVLFSAGCAWSVAYMVDLIFRAAPFVAAVPAFCALPLASGTLLGLTVAPASTGKDASRLLDRAGDLRPDRAFWQFVFTVALVGVVSETVVYLNSYEESSRLASMSNADIAALIVAVLLATYAAVRPRSYGYNRLYYPAIFLVMALLALLFVFPQGTGWALVVSLAAYEMFGLLVWCMLCCITACTKASPGRVLGFGYGVQVLGGVAGYLLGSGLDQALEARSGSPLVIYLAVAMIILALCVAVYPPRAMRDLLLAIPDEDAEIVVGPSAVSSAWDAACERLAESCDLTAREREVMAMLSRGRGSVFMADQLGVSISTVYTHTRNIYRKVGVHSREELMDAVERRGYGE